MNNYQISNRQGLLLVMATVLGTVFLPLPGVVTASAGSAGWMGALLGYSASAIPAYFIYKVCNKYPGKNLAQIIEILVGRILGRLINVYIMLVFFYLSSMLIRQLGELYSVVVMPRTPIIVFGSTILILVVFILRQGLEVLARVNEILISLLLVTLLGMVVLVLGDINLDHMLPFMGEGLGGIAVGGLLTFAVAMEYVLILGFILPQFRMQEKAGIYVLAGVVVGVITHLAVIVSVVGVFEVNEVNRFLYPIIQLAKVVELGEFIKGVEVLLVGGWTIASLLAITIYMYVALSAMAQVFGIDDFRELVMVVALLSIAVSMTPDSLQALIRELQILDNIFFLFIGLTLPGFLFILLKVRGNTDEP
ncbi:spore germination protein (amino acid permease) [Desulfitispora alkaliphila]|uniref:GerAB/ArcD/ProY family transporter n=1 Tax=Desulfitispora alkaliphila TaxID=622674 RepID=UPI003D1EED83